MSVLIVGGAGYIGSHMVKLLQQTNCHIVVLDNLSNGFRDAITDAEFILGSVNDAELLTGLFAQYQFDAVIHFASFIQVGESISHPQKYYDNNLVATLTLLNAMREAGVSRLIFLLPLPFMAILFIYPSMKITRKNQSIRMEKVNGWLNKC